MSELSNIIDTPPRVPRKPSERLGLEVGILAGRLADYLDRVLPDDSALAKGRAFLRSSFAAVASLPSGP